MPAAEPVDREGVDGAIVAPMAGPNSASLNRILPNSLKPSHGSISRWCRSPDVRRAGRRKQQCGPDPSRDADLHVGQMMSTAQEKLKDEAQHAVQWTNGS
ncbi:hypothetical protein [Bradyrhizobium sp.]|uniref:hypothetical protein n=1 Tax=Bradyrhizobium sp. TaxID=376 RepID=UPI0025BA75D8|nr:hypothetical protein [Bradyrhizobium sp.]